MKQEHHLAPGARYCVIKDAREWEIDLERTASEFDTAYYRGLLKKALGEAAFMFTQTT